MAEDLAWGTSPDTSLVPSITYQVRKVKILDQILKTLVALIS